ncbi:MAG TPA: hypothetical protein VMF52_03230 [Steroidobacteraceae bacterium]|nr:hypothetical protein [Steroidobacteraceae bacterium]
MNRRRRASRGSSGASLLALVPLLWPAPGALAKDKPPAFRVAGLTFKPGAPLDGEIRGACDVAKIVTDSIQHEKAGKAPTTDLVVRIDRVVRLRGTLDAGPVPGGTELGITLLAAGPKPLDQPFLCRKYARVATTPAAHCARVEKCADTIAEQISSWLAPR